MRASAPTAAPSASGNLPSADAKVAGNGAGAAAPQTAATAAASEHSADSSADSTSGQPFAAALASAQAASARKRDRTEAAASDSGPLECEPAQLESEPRPERRVAAAPQGAATVETAAERPPVIVSALAAATPLPIAIAIDPANRIEAAGPSPSKTAGDVEMTAHEAKPAKGRADKHRPTAPGLEAAVLSTLASLLGAAAAQGSTLAPAAAATAAPRSHQSGSGADAAAATSIAAKHGRTQRAAAEIAAPSPSPADASTADRTAPIDRSLAPGASLAASQAESRLASAGSPGSGSAPVMQGLNAAANAPAAPPAASIGVPVAHPDWPHALAAQVQWMATRQIQSATLRLSPEHLGPLEVRIDVTRSQINVNFTAHHADTREALAQAVPQLRQLFAAGGLNLGEATVRQDPHSSHQPPPSPPSSATGAAETVERVANTAFQRLGLVDEYA